MSGPDQQSENAVEQSTAARTPLQGVHVVAIDDDPVALRALETHLSRRGCIVQTSGNGSDGLELIDDSVAVALIDMRMPGLSGLDCLRYIKQYHSSVKVIIVTGSSDVGVAVEAMKKGAFQYVCKPFIPESLSIQVEKAYEAWKAGNENSGLRDVLSMPGVPDDLMFAKSDPDNELLAAVARISQLDSTVLIGGESGTGKTTIARMIHQSGPRSAGSFIAINCASLPRDLIESELFGHARGAFTGAINERIGKAELADGGTLFLDEIGDLPIELQPKLLTFIQDRCIHRVGCNITRPVDVRLVVATHRDLAAMAGKNQFRQDLYYRLNVLSLYLPPLRERSSDLSSIARSIIKSICRRQKRQTLRLSDDAIVHLRSYQWPGNIRELENVLERAIAFTDGDELLPEDLDLKLPPAAVSVRESDTTETPPAYSLAGMTLQEIEAQAILETLEASQGNKARTARMLGISEKSIYNKMKRLGISYPPIRQEH
ncbi:MAG: sigma-54 dependent transcriptional regulator [Planctomycetota bacterium]